MERLKVYDDILEKYIVIEFTFQYGEIKRHGIKVSVRESKTFTFQYGEIKSILPDVVEVPVIQIYIPVWRD